MSHPVDQSLTPGDPLLRARIDALAPHRLLRVWAQRADPIEELNSECRAVASANDWIQNGSGYLASHPIIQHSLTSLLAHLSMAANTRWQDTPAVTQTLARRGWHLNRWVPTFLLINGPLGRLLRDPHSPICASLRTRRHNLPMLSDARDAFNSDMFRKVRNGFGHWSFRWDEVGGSDRITVINWETDVEEVTLTLLAAEALHSVTFEVVRALDMHVLRSFSPDGA